MQDPSVDFTPYSGVGGEFVKAAFEENLTQAESDFSALDAAIQRTVAYYMTLCDTGSRNFVRDTVYNSLQILLDEADYACPGSGLLEPYGNTDNDGQFNIEEWEQSDGDVGAYLGATLNGNDDTLLIPGSPPVYFEETCDYCTKGTIQLNQHGTDGDGDLGAAEFVMMIDGIPVQNGTPVAYGRWIDVAAKADASKGYQFDHWEAEGNLLHGERSRRARFMLMPRPAGAKSLDPPVYVWPVYYRGSIDVPVDNAMVDYTFTANGDVLGPQTVTYNGQTLHRYRGPFGSSVTGTYEIQPGYDPGAGYYAYKSGWNITSADTVTLAITPDGSSGGAAYADVYEDSVPEISGQKLTFTVGGTQGLIATFGTHLLGAIEIDTGYLPGQTLPAFTVSGTFYRKSPYWSVSAMPGSNWLCDFGEGECTNAEFSISSNVSGSFSPVIEEVRTVELKLDINAEGEFPQDQVAGFFVVQPAKADYVYTQGTPVTITARNHCGYKWYWWNGNGVDSASTPPRPLDEIEENPLHIIMDDDRAVTAFFASGKDVVGSILAELFVLNSSTNPPSYELVRAESFPGHQEFEEYEIDPTRSVTAGGVGQHVPLFYNEVCDPNTANAISAIPGPFFIEDAYVRLTGINQCYGWPLASWSIEDSPSGAGTLELNPENMWQVELHDLFRGGIYVVRLDVGYHSPSYAIIILPLAGSELDPVFRADLTKADAFAAAAKAAMTLAEIKRNQEVWFSEERSDNADYWGRATGSSIQTQTVAQYNPTDYGPSTGVPIGMI